MNTIANKIDHTMLKSEATTETIRRYCKEAKEYGFASVCVNTYHVPLVICKQRIFKIIRRKL